MAEREFERRVYPLHELRIEAGEKRRELVGHAAVFDSYSEEMWGFREVIKPGAFEETIKTGDVRALFNHDPNYVLGRNKAGTLKLAEDSRGLRVRISPPDVQWANDLMTSIDRGDISQMSFAFRGLEEKWEKEDGEDVRILEKVKLFDVSPVTFPAYSDTDIALRSLQAHRTHERAAAAAKRIDFALDSARRWL